MEQVLPGEKAKKTEAKKTEAKKPGERSAAKFFVGPDEARAWIKAIRNGTRPDDDDPEGEESQDRTGAEE